MAVPEITRAHRVLIGGVATGALIIAGIGFTGSYAAVRTLALHKGFGDFSYVFPVGVDVGIAVLLALDLVLTWLRIPFPLLRQTAWLLTAGTIVFNAASSWGDPLAMSMHAIIPVLFVVVVEAARHAVGRMADITADKHMESVRLMRWLLSPVPTFRLWRRMKLWEMRSYDEVVRMEQNRLVYRTHLRAQFGRNWRRQAPIETLLPLKLAKYGVPLDLEVIRAVTRPVRPAAVTAAVTTAGELPTEQAVPTAAQAQPRPAAVQPAAVQPTAVQPTQPVPPAQQQPVRPQPQPVQPQPVQQPVPVPVLPLTGPKPDPRPVAVDLLSKLAQRHRRPLHDPDGLEPAVAAEEFAGPVENPTRGVGWLPRGEPSRVEPEEAGPEAWFAAKVVPEAAAAAAEEPDAEPAPTDAPADATAEATAEATVDQYFEGLCAFIDAYSYQPDEQKLAEYLFSEHGITGRGGDRPVSVATLRRHWPELQQRFAERYE
ncbi:DUF2637 domain-containing protein [Streptacidiphilus sp. P02-A3a]|uniref:DUF2637 domain-containing protein n=1 Tax=Streptacidiphilus sp. P02-A3a TaxID=2704468 RepID=UPI0015FD3193|nr:DUF2637 domain-containing protein [Streptacidiphilus sp. P02-A3a]QMU72755.1 DUF2637 domain-containing protein [Streptacidiphilus sp. P02-A3a]